MKRTRNGILIPDVPIMASGNLPNAVKGYIGANRGGDYENKSPFWIESLEDENVISIKNLGSASSISIDVEYSFDNKNWEIIHTSQASFDISVSLGQRVYFRSSATSWGNTDNQFYTNKKVNVGGNLLSLNLGSQFVGQREFDGISKLEALLYNSKVVDASNLLFPFNRGSYMRFFQGCIYLERAPYELPCKSYNNYMYQFMFTGCSSLTVAPIIQCEEIYGTQMLKGMFEDCSQLREIRMNANAVNSSHMQNFSKNVATNGVFFKKRGVSYATGINGIPTGWTVEEID